MNSELLMSSSHNPRAQGTHAEDEALRFYLDRHRSRLVTRNYYSRSGEIDLVFEDKTLRGPELVFVEVKSRKAHSLVAAIDCLSPAKKRRLTRAIQHYLARYRGPAQTMRVDLLAQDGGEWAHIKSIALL